VNIHMLNSMVSSGIWGTLKFQQVLLNQSFTTKKHEQLKTKTQQTGTGKGSRIAVCKQPAIWADSQVKRSTQNVNKQNKTEQSKTNVNKQKQVMMKAEHIASINKATRYLGI